LNQLRQTGTSHPVLQQTPVQPGYPQLSKSGDYGIAKLVRERKEAELKKHDYGIVRLMRLRKEAGATSTVAR
jgi:hypothetical protein